MEKLDRNLLSLVKAGFSKKAFVPRPGGLAEPVVGASPMTAAMASGGIGAPQGGGDPSMGGGMPVDPAMAGGMPMDPSMAGGMPMDPSMGGGMPIDPAMLGMDPAAMMGAEAGPSKITLTVQELIELVQALGGGAAVKKPKADAANGAAPAPANGGSPDMSAKLDQILAAISPPSAMTATGPSMPGGQSMPMQ